MKFKESTSCKIAAIIFSYVMALVLVVSVAGTAVMGYYKFYFSDVDALKEEILSDMAQNEAYHISNLLEWEEDLEKYYKNKNVFFKVTFTESGEILTNYNDEQYMASASAGHYEYKDTYFKDEYGATRYKTEEIKLGEIEVFISADLHKNDLFSAMAKIIEIGYSLRFVMVFIALGALALFMFLLCYLYCAAGHRTDGIIKCNYFDKMPFDFLAAVVAVIAFFSIQFALEIPSDIFSAFIVLVPILTIDYFVALGYTMSFATRVKTRTLIKNNIIYYILRFFGIRFKKLFKWVKFVFTNASLLQKVWVVILGIVAVSFIFTIIVTYNLYDAREFFVLAMFIITAAIVLVVLYLAVILQRIKLGGERIAKGDLQYKIETKYMFGDFKGFAESLNNINDGLQTAVNERMKSERFKTELITNVSHDIKTPLTSIINYVDLIKKENPENETVKQYIDVLDRQSGRLKKLVEDLVEASKASTGNIAVNLVNCDIGVLLSQTLGEFEEKLSRANVQPVLNCPDTKIQIMADGIHLWRVFDNLMTNICKYSLEGTRAYIDVKKENCKAVITFRNISKYQLNVRSEDLLERFVRGDSSRNTEGSGLGLSIAKSLVELQKGEMSLSVDGDLFKAVLKFDLI